MTTLPNRSETMTSVLPPIRGMNTKDPPHHMIPGQGIDNWNVEIEEVQGINKRKGFTPFNTASTLIPRYSEGTIKEITGPMVYFSGLVTGAGLTASVCSTSDVLFMLGNSTPVYWQISTLVGTATLSLAVAYTQTVTASSYLIGPKQIDNIYNFKYGTTQKLVAFAGQDLYAATAAATGSFTKVSAGLEDYQNVSATIFQDKLWFCNGYQYKVYDGSSIAAVGGTPDPSDPLYVGVYTIGNANWLWIGGSNTAADFSQFAFSDVNAAETYPATNVYLAGDRDGSRITGGAPIPGGWAIFKDSSIFVFSGVPGSGTLRKVVSDVGCIAPRSIRSYKGQVIFVGRKGKTLGVYAFNGTSNIAYLSEDLEPTFIALKQSAVESFTAEIYNDKYVVGARNASGTYNNEHYTVYLDRGFLSGNKTHWPWVRGNRGYNDLLSQVVSGTDYLFSASPTGGFVYHEDNGNSDDTTDNIYGGTAAIAAYSESAWIFMGDRTKRKEILRGYLDITNSGSWNMKLRVYKDFLTYGYNDFNISLSSATLTWAEIVYLSTPWQSSVDKSIDELSFPYPSTATHFKFRFINENANEPFTVYPMSIYYKKEAR